MPGGILTIGELHIAAVHFAAIALTDSNVLANSFL